MLKAKRAIDAIDNTPLEQPCTVYDMHELKKLAFCVRQYEEIE